MRHVHSWAIRIGQWQRKLHRLRSREDLQTPSSVWISMTRSQGYVSTGNASLCLPCAPGWFTSGSAASLCSVCQPGRYQDRNGTANCIDCAPVTCGRIDVAIACTLPHARCITCTLHRRAGLLVQHDWRHKLLPLPTGAAQSEHRQLCVRFVQWRHVRCNERQRGMHRLLVGECRSQSRSDSE